MSECKKHRVFLVTKYHYQIGNFELHVKTKGLDPSVNEWGWTIWRSQPFDEVKTSNDMFGLFGPVGTLIIFFATGFAEHGLMWRNPNRRKPLS